MKFLSLLRHCHFKHTEMSASCQPICAAHAAWSKAQISEHCIQMPLAFYQLRPFSFIMVIPRAPPTPFTPLLLHLLETLEFPVTSQSKGCLDMTPSLTQRPLFWGDRLVQHRKAICPFPPQKVLQQPLTPNRPQAQLSGFQWIWFTWIHLVLAFNYLFIQHFLYLVSVQLWTFLC